MTKPLSEGISLLQLGHNSAGLPIHKARQDEFISIKVVQAKCLDEDIVVINNENEAQRYFRVTIGEATFALIFKEEEGIIAEDIPVYAGEEVWVTCSSPRKFVMFGTTNKVQK